MALISNDMYILKVTLQIIFQPAWACLLPYAVLNSLLTACVWKILYVDVDSYASLMNESTYKSASISGEVSAQTYLSLEDCHALNNILDKYCALFDGIL